MSDQTAATRDQKDLDGNAVEGGRSLWRRWTALRDRLPRPDLLLLLLALLWTLGAKLLAVREQSPVELVFPFVQAVLPDMVFFSVIAGLFTLAYLVPWRRAAARLTLVAAAAILGWAVLNGAWLMTTGVQLQPGVLLVLMETSSDMWDLAIGYMFRHPMYLVAVVVTLLIAGSWFVLRLFWPLVSDASPRRLASQMTVYGLAALIFAAGLHLSHRPGLIAYSGQIIGFSSHWYAITNLIAEVGHGDIAAEARELPRAGERTLELPDTPRDELPNVVIVLLESLPFGETSMADPSRDLTPVFARFASEGVEFRRSYMPIPQTTKAFWSTFTGMYPEMLAGYAEALIADEPYEGLPTILGRLGYRSSFFQMSPGTFESLPAFFANLDFDKAWFIEHLRDPDAFLTMLSGDDYRLLDPMFDWVDEGDEPFLLTMITSVAHDPFIVPDWHTPREEQSDDRSERFRLALQFQDEWFEAFLDQLDERGLRENTIVVALGDHGESFRPEARRGRWGIFEELVRVPMAIRWPEAIEPGQVVEGLCSAIDIVPTVLSLMGFDITEADFDGLDALGPIPDDRRIYLSAWHRNSPIGFVDLERKIIYWPSTDVMFEYDLTNDPGETDPRTVRGEERAQLIEDIFDKQQSTHFQIAPRRFREAVFYDHWRVFSTGRTGRSFFVDADNARSE